MDGNHYPSRENLRRLTRTQQRRVIDGVYVPVHEILRRLLGLQDAFWRQWIIHRAIREFFGDVGQILAVPYQIECRHCGSASAGSTISPPPTIQTSPPTDIPVIASAVPATRALIWLGRPTQ